MTPEEIAAKVAATAAAEDEAKAKADADSQHSQDPLKQELDKVTKKTAGKTELEKALFTKQQIDKRISELQKESGVVDEPVNDDDSAPVTIGMLKQIEREKAAKTAVQLADEIDDATERDLTKHHLAFTIKPSGNPTEDLRNARLLVNAVKNKQLIDEASRKTTTRQYSSGTGAPARQDTTGEFIPSPEEAMFMKTMKLTKEDILKARKASEARRG